MKALGVSCVPLFLHLVYRLFLSPVVLTQSSFELFVLFISVDDFLMCMCYTLTSLQKNFAEVNLQAIYALLLTVEGKVGEAGCWDQLMADQAELGMLASPTQLGTLI